MVQVEEPSADPDRAPGAAPAPAGRIEVAYALPARQFVIVLPLPPDGLTARVAVERSGLLEQFPELGIQPLVLGIYGTVCGGERQLRDGDRVEIYRPLKQDPRASRRERAASAPRKGRRG
jgi:putative ubiquitin-RnfH superfamily antitoxin RatB of RatAB toxin-antitoxin module